MNVYVTQEMDSFVEKITTLLDGIIPVVDDNAKKRNLKDADFNIFRVCRVDHAETIHSAILAELLNPNGSCALAKVFTELFFKRLNVQIPMFNFDKYSVNTEYVIPQKRRIDILIEDGINAVAIENKIYAADQQRQLDDYDAFLDLKYRTGLHTLYYLTLFGKMPSKESCSNPSICQRISYRNEIEEWLDECVKISQDHPVIQNTVLQYLTHLKSLTGDTMDKDYNAKLAEVIFFNRKNYEAAQAIADNLKELKEEWLSRFWQTLLSVTVSDPCNSGADTTLEESFGPFVLKDNFMSSKRSLDTESRAFPAIALNSVAQCLQVGVFSRDRKANLEWINSHAEIFSRISAELNGCDNKTDWWITGSKRIAEVDTPEFWEKHYNSPEKFAEECSQAIVLYFCKVKELFHKNINQIGD